MKPATEILLSAAFALTPAENWTQGGFARTASRRWIGMDLPHAACWCVEGALYQAKRTLGLTGNDSHAAWIALSNAVGTGPASFNDTHTHAEVLDALYRAAELAEGK